LNEAMDEHPGTRTGSARGPRGTSAGPRINVPIRRSAFRARSESGEDVRMRRVHVCIGVHSWVFVIEDKC
jgi:hypothetical protein